VQAYSLKLYPLRQFKGFARALRSVRAYAGISTALSRCGARWYGMVYDNAPLLAIFVDDGWYEPALSFGLALGPFEFGFILGFRGKVRPLSLLPENSER